MVELIANTLTSATLANRSATLANRSFGIRNVDIRRFGTRGFDTRTFGFRNNKPWPPQPQVGIWGSNRRRKILGPFWAL